MAGNPEPTPENWIWANCSRGDEAVQKQFPLLTRFNIPLGTDDVDVNCRMKILSNLIQFNEKIMGSKLMPLEGNNKREENVIKVPRFLCEQKQDNFRRSEIVDLFLDSLYEDKAVAADNVCLYLAKSTTSAQEAASRQCRKKAPHPPLQRPSLPRASRNHAGTTTTTTTETAASTNATNHYNYIYRSAWLPTRSENVRI